MSKKGRQHSFHLDFLSIVFVSLTFATETKLFLSLRVGDLFLFILFFHLLHTEYCFTALQY
jgi:hypothetical protein